MAKKQEGWGGTGAAGVQIDKARIPENENVDVGHDDLVRMFALARQSLPNLRRFLVPIYDKRNLLPSPGFHYTLSNEILFGKNSLCIEGFRQCAKSELISTACLYALRFPRVEFSYIPVIKFQSGAATKMLRQVKQDYCDSPLLNTNIEGIDEASESALQIRVRDDEGNVITVRFEAYGKGSSIRGANWMHRRPDVVLMDDVQDKAEMRSETIHEDDWSWFLSDIKMLGVSSRIFFISNNLGEKCIAERLFAIARKEGGVAHGFKCFRIPAMVSTNDGYKSAWEEALPIEMLKKEQEEYTRDGKAAEWLCERMCMAVSEATQVFNPAWYKYTDQNFPKKVRQGREYNIYLLTDFALSEEESADFTALAVVAVDQRGTWFVLEIAYGRWMPPEALDKLFEVVRRWRPCLTTVENGIFKRFFEPIIHKEMANRNVFFQMQGVSNRAGGVSNAKLVRMKALAPRVRAGKLWFVEGAPYLGELKTEMSGIANDAIKSIHDDLVDALAFGEEVCAPPVVDSEENSDENLQREIA